jgi:leucyl aminopeptidase
MGKTARLTLPSRKQISAEVIVAGSFEGEAPELPSVDDELVSIALARAAETSWTGRKGRVLAGISAKGREVVIVGLGPRESFDATGLESLADRAIAIAGSRSSSRLALQLPDHAVSTQAAGRVQTRLALGRYSFEDFRQQEGPREELKAVQLLPPADAAPSHRRRLETATALADAIAWARDLANTPPNVATPAWMASQARRLARRSAGMKVRVLGPRELEKKRMGAILAVGAGSHNTPRLVRLEIGTEGPIVSIVGKGVTFDTGGISIKPAAAMDEMKYDKCGACTVLGIAQAVAALELPVRLRAYLPLAENMPSGTAYRPSDIVRCYNGKTVEVLNTDAEGRMILADALAWAAEEKPDHLIEYSTLTGAAVVALGERGAALYTPEDRLAQDLLEAADDSGELLWRMPLWPCYLEEMRGEHADLRNSGSRWGGANTAAAFLSQFVGEQESWAHIDIAGPAMTTKPKGATGYGVAFTVGWLQALSAPEKGSR